MYKYTIKPASQCTWCSVVVHTVSALFNNGRPYVGLGTHTDYQCQDMQLIGGAVPPRSALISREIEMTRLHQTVHSKLGVCSDTRAEVIGSTGFLGP